MLLEAEHRKGHVTDSVRQTVPTHFTNGEPEALRGCATCPESQQPGNEELRPDPGPTPGPMHSL